MEYTVTPFMAWLIAGSFKFAINSIKAGQLAFGQIGYGGLPSNHSAIVSSMAALIAIKNGINTPSFGVAITLCFIVIMDANSLRRQIGKHAVEINKLKDINTLQLKERMGHTRIEIAAGIITGIITAWTVNLIFQALA